MVASWFWIVILSLRLVFCANVSQTASGDWTKPTTWNLGGTPNVTDSVFIQTRGSYVIISTNITVDSITIGTISSQCCPPTNSSGGGLQRTPPTSITIRCQAALIIKNGATLTVRGSINIQATGSLYLLGGNIVTSTLVNSGGSLSGNGSINGNVSNSGWIFGRTYSLVASTLKEIAGTSRLTFSSLTCMDSSNIFILFWGATSYTSIGVTKSFEASGSFLLQFSAGYNLDTKQLYKPLIIQGSSRGTFDAVLITNSTYDQVSQTIDDSISSRYNCTTSTSLNVVTPDGGTSNKNQGVLSSGSAPDGSDEGNCIPSFAILLAPGCVPSDTAATSQAPLFDAGSLGTVVGSQGQMSILWMSIISVGVVIIVIIVAVAIFFTMRRRRSTRLRTLLRKRAAASSEATTQDTSDISMEVSSRVSTREDGQ